MGTDLNSTDEIIRLLKEYSCELNEELPNIKERCPLDAYRYAVIESRTLDALLQIMTMRQEIMPNIKEKQD